MAIVSSPFIVTKILQQCDVVLDPAVYVERAPNIGYVVTRQCLIEVSNTR